MLLSLFIGNKHMNSNIIRFATKLRPITKADVYKNSNPVYFSIEDDDFTYMRFGKVSVIKGKDSFAKRLTLVKS